MSRSTSQPLRRRHVMVGGLVVAVLVAGIVGLAEMLRHPLPAAPPDDEIDEPAADPRIDVECPEPQPREGRERDGEAVAPAAAPVEVTSNELLDCPQSFHRRTVRYQGEVVGGVHRRDGGAWVQLNDDIYAGTVGPLPAHRDYRGGNAGVGVFLPAELVGQIRMVGGPQTRGDLLEVVGVFHRVDAATQEVAVIRARTGETIRTGEPFAETPLHDRQVAAGLLALLALGFITAERLATRRRRRR